MQEKESAIKVDTSKVLPLQACSPVNIDFNDITYTVNVSRSEKKQLLQGISGEFRAGQLTAIMGPSGAGKTSLLNILSGLQREGVRGEILMNGRDRNICNAEFRKKACFIQQDDILLDLFSTHEVMMMAADLKLGSTMGHKAKTILIDDILEALGLAQCKRTRCGRLSGGQRKRLSIAMELTNNPAIMFLDEPTTGLDSSTSLQCVSLMKSMARGGRVVMCTIHQPSANVLQMFDHVYVLAEGQCVYRGTPAGLLPFLEALGLPCPQYYSPVDYLMDVASGEYGPHIKALSEAAKECSWGEPAEPITPAVVVQEMCLEHPSGGIIPPRSPSPAQAGSISEWQRFLVLMHRCLLQLHRDWTVTHLKLLLHILVGVIVGANFTGCGNDASRTISNISFLFCVPFYLSYTAMMPAILRYPMELMLIKREWFNNWYKLRTYYIASFVTNAPIQMMYCTVFCSITYFLSGQPLDSVRFAMFLGVCVITTFVAESIGLQLGSIYLKNFVMALFFGSVYLAILLILSGFLCLIPHMPAPMAWLSYFSFLRYSYEGTIVSLYSNGREKMPCPEQEIYCHLRDPVAMLTQMGMRDVVYWKVIVALFSFLLFLRTLTFISIKRKLTSE